MGPHNDNNNITNMTTTTTTTTTNTDHNDISDLSTYLAVLAGGIAVAIVLVFVVRCFLRHVRRKVQEQKEERQKKCVYPYLQNMDANDVDIRRAPTGGWHGTYLNKLADGVNKYETSKRSKSRYDDGDEDEETIVIEDCLHKSNFSIDDDIIDDIVRNGGVAATTTTKARRKSSLFADATSSAPYCLGDDEDDRARGKKAVVDNETFGLLVLPDGDDDGLDNFDRSEHRALQRSYRMEDDTI